MQTLSSLLLPCLLWATTLGAQGPGYLGVVLRATEAAVVSEVVEGSAAAKVGLQPGDAMVAVDGAPTLTREAFVAAVQAHAAGERLRVRFRRDDRERVVVVKLGERPSPPAAAMHVRVGTPRHAACSLDAPPPVSFSSRPSP